MDVVKDNMIEIASGTSCPRNDVRMPSVSRNDSGDRDVKSPACPINLNWADNPDIQKLLDVICEIIANEYIEVAKRNKDVFEIALSSSAPRNDEGENLPPMTSEKMEV